MIFFLISVPVLARENTDVIVMKNGDRMTGQIKGFNAGVLYLELEYVDGTMKVQWSKVARLESKHQFIVETQEGSKYTGTIKGAEGSSGKPMRVQVIPRAEEAIDIDESKITQLDQTSARLWQRANGALNFGTTYSKGEEATQYNLSSQTEYLQERWRAEANFSSNFSSSTGSSATTRNELDLGAFHLLPWRQYFYGGLASFLQSSEQGIQRQTNLGGGIGRYLKNNNHFKLSVLGGLAWQNTSYQQSFAQSTVGGPRQNVAAAMITANLKLSTFKKTNLSVMTSVFPALSQPGRIFVNTNATYYIKLFGNLSWNFSLYGDWDNRAPRALPGSDYGTSSGVTWTFGNR